MELRFRGRHVGHRQTRRLLQLFDIGDAIGGIHGTLRGGRGRRDIPERRQLRLLLGCDRRLHRLPRWKLRQLLAQCGRGAPV